MNPKFLEIIFRVAIIAALFAFPACKTTTDLRVQSQNDQAGNQTIELHRSVDTAQ